MMALRGFLLRLISGERLAYAGLQAVLLQAVAVLLNVVTGVITARVLGAEGRGLYAAATTWAVLLGSLSTAGLSHGLLIQTRQRTASSRPIFLCGLLWTIGVATVLSAAAAVYMPLLLGARAAAALDLARASLVLVHLGALGVLVRQAYAGQGRYLAANLSTFTPTLLHAVLLVAFLVSGRLSVATSIVSVVGGSTLALLALAPPLLRRLQGSLSDLGRVWRDLADFGRRALFADLFALCVTWADRLILLHLLSPAQLGLYVVAASLAHRITVFTPKTSLLLSAMSGEQRDRAVQLHNLSLRVTIAVFIPLVAALFLIDRMVMTTVYGPAFSAAAVVFRVLVVERVVGRLASISSQLFLALGRPGLNSLIRGVELCVLVVALINLAPKHGAVGAAWGLLAATSVRLVLSWAFLVSRLQLPFPRLWLSRGDLVGMRAMLD
ncbi:oligosaccharide flippase family protein [Phenylobacterium sp.]|uniref:oligosaccharide flippase family protein n=1 Tax=Phenylobacterium sp. TaxID=1871053 RepID=UPI0028120A5F|nr:oligosaccharide flippase family protein [Phenylobacterium sp.]